MIVFRVKKCKEEEEEAKKDSYIKVIKNLIKEKLVIVVSGKKKLFVASVFALTIKCEIFFFTECVKIIYLV